MQTTVLLFLALWAGTAWGQCPPDLVNPLITVDPTDTTACTVGTVYHRGHTHITHHVTSGTDIDVTDDSTYFAALGVSEASASRTDHCLVTASNRTSVREASHVFVVASEDVNVTGGSRVSVLNSNEVLVEYCDRCTLASAAQVRISGGDISDIFVQGGDIELSTPGTGASITGVFVVGGGHRIAFSGPSSTASAVGIIIVGGGENQVVVGDGAILLVHIFGGLLNVFNTTASPLLTGTLLGNAVFGGVLHQVRTTPTAVVAPEWNSFFGGGESIVETRGTGTVLLNTMVGGFRHRFIGALAGTARMFANAFFGGRESHFNMSAVTVGDQTDSVVVGGAGHRVYGIAGRVALVAGRGHTLTDAVDCGIFAGVEGSITSRGYTGTLQENVAVGGYRCTIGLQLSGTSIHKSGVFAGNNNGIESSALWAALMEADAILGGRLLKIQGGSYTIMAGGKGSAVLDTSYAAVIAGIEHLISNGADASAVVGGGRPQNGNTIDNAKRGVIVGGQGHRIPAGVDDAVILGGENVTAFASGATMGAAWIASGAANFGAPNGGLVRQGGYTTFAFPAVNLFPLQVIQGYSISAAPPIGSMTINLPAAATYAPALAAMGITEAAGMRLADLLFHCHFGSGGVFSIVSAVSDIVQSGLGGVTTATVTCGVDQVCRMTPVITGPGTIRYFYVVT